MPNQFNKRLRKLRKDAGYTLDELAAETGCSKSYVWELENKPVVRPSADLIYRLSGALGVTMEFLMGYEPNLTASTDTNFCNRYLTLPDGVRKQIRAISQIIGENI